MKLNVLIASVFFVSSLLPGISFAQDKVVTIPLVQNKAVGDAKPGDVLKGKTFSSDACSGLVGTMTTPGIPPPVDADGDGWTEDVD